MVSVFHHTKDDRALLMFGVGLKKFTSRIRHHLADPSSHHRRIVEGFLWVSMFVLLGKLAGAAKEMAIAWRYGVSATVDAYVFVFNLVNWPLSVWFSILTVVLVPLAARLRNDQPAELSRFRSELLAFTLLLGTALGAVFFFGLPVLLHTGWAGLAGESLEQALLMAAPLSLMLPLGFVISLFSAWMMAGGRHRNTLFEAVPALIILLALLMPPGWIPEPLLWGTVAGFALHMFFLGWPLQRVGELSAPIFHLHSPAWQGFWGGIGIMSLGQLLSSLTGIVDQFLAANLSEGALSTLSYANRILSLILGMGATAIGRATLPVFSQARAAGSVDINALALNWAKWMFLAGLFVALAGALASPILVELLFERGAFTPDNTRSVAAVFSWSMIQVPFFFAGLVLVSTLGAGGYYSLIALSGGTNLLFKLFFASLLVRKYQLIGLVLSTSAMYALSLLLLYIAVKLVARREKRVLKAMS